MYYYYIYKLDFLKNLKLGNKVKYIVTLFLGTLCYFSTYKILNSTFINSHKILSQYKDYLYYLTTADIVVLLGFMYHTKNKKIKHKPVVYTLESSKNVEEEKIPVYTSKLDDEIPLYVSNKNKTDIE